MELGKNFSTLFVNCKKPKRRIPILVLLSFPFLQILTNQTDCKILNQVCNFQFQHKLTAATTFFFFFFFFFFCCGFFFSPLCVCVCVCVIYLSRLVFWVKEEKLSFRWGRDKMVSGGKEKVFDGNGEETGEWDKKWRKNKIKGKVEVSNMSK